MRNKYRHRRANSTAFYIQVSEPLLKRSGIAFFSTLPAFRAARQLAPIGAIFSASGTMCIGGGNNYNDVTFNELGGL